MSAFAPESRLGSERSGKKPTFDVTVRPEPPLIKHASLRLEDLAPAVSDRLHGRFSRQALRSINTAIHHLDSALCDFDRHPYYRIGSTLPEARAYLLGALMNLMKTCKMTREERKEVLNLFKSSNLFTSSEFQEQLDKIVSGRIPDTADGAKVRMVLTGAKAITRIMKDQYSNERQQRRIINTLAAMPRFLGFVAKDLV